MKKVSLFAALTVAAFTYSCNNAAETVETAAEATTETVENATETAAEATTEAVETVGETAQEVVTETTEAVEAVQNATENK